MRILSGIQPSGTLHLGNYFGMMRPAVELQQQGEAFYFIADLHALTTVQDAGLLRQFSHEVAIDFLACGLDPSRSAFFLQSSIPAVTELAWILSTVTPMGLLERCHSFKDKTARGLPASHGLFAYPVLMAADILIYDSDVVPVGKDQKQHIEVTRDLAQKFNDLFGEVLRIPKPSIRQESGTIPGIDGDKMSKTYGNTIGLFEPENVLRKKIMSIKTDSTPVEEPKAVEGSAILALYRLVSSESDYAVMEGEFRNGGVGYGDFKKRLFGAVLEYFADARARRVEIQSDPAYVSGVLSAGAARANQIASQVIERVRGAVGLGGCA